MTQIIPIESGVVFHVPYDQCDEWLIITPDLTVTMTPMINEENDGTPTRSIEEHDGAWSNVHLHENCKGTYAHYDDWEFEGMGVT